MRGLVVDEGLCFGCRACTFACTPSLISLRETNGFRVIRFPGICEEDCTRCREVCPKEAIAFEETDREQAGRELRFVLRSCDRCGRPFAPEKMLADLVPGVQEAMATEENPWLGWCLSCRREAAVSGLLEAL